MAEVNTTYVRARLSELLRCVEASESITITRRGTPIAAPLPIKRHVMDLVEFLATHAAGSKAALPMSSSGCGTRTGRASIGKWHAIGCMYARKPTRLFSSCQHSGA